MKSVFLKFNTFIFLLLLLSNSKLSAQEDLCDYSRLIDGTTIDSEKKEREDYYLKMLGILTELKTYRSSFLADGKLVNLFPTVYYHTTWLEVNRIRKNMFDYPTEKMRQMLYFYDSYKYNRIKYDSGSICEPHWQKHFDEVNAANNSNIISNINSHTCNSIRLVINSAIRAHVKFDLARAIRHAYDNRSNTNISPEMLESDFLSTETIFSEANALSIPDINNKHGYCGTIGGWNMSWFGAAITTAEIIEWRTKSFNDAIIIRIPLQGYYTPTLIAQPSYLPHSVLLQKGKSYCKNENPTLFLFDVSGSMSQNNKWSSAKQSALTTLNNIKVQAQSANISPSISILSFDGACNNDPTKSVVGFTTNLQEVENAINTKIPPPGGATPLPQAIATSEQKLNDYLTANNINKGKLIILTDGESSCGSLRPAGVYNSVDNNSGFSSSNKTSSKNIKYYAIGFDIQPGSAAERDLQYFTQINGGKYVNAQNAQELTSAFQKFNRIFIPKPSPSITTVIDSDNAIFQQGISLIYDEEYDEALNNYSKYYKNNATDFNGVYNLAIMSEANDLYKAAIKYYEMYLQLNPKANDKVAVQQTIANLKITANAYAEYNKKVVQSDLEYLNLHFKKIQNGESVTLATEFVGFLNEKYNFYKNLSSIVENEDRLFKTNANEVYKGIKDCADAIKRNPQTWDRDASPIISRTYLNMERLIESF
ncbi:VWA domain-containing protein [Flavobacterium sp.]|uniref:VWA domain-containing protein n=1 Tax=Flavobacterium sp. TaxID=239 RepID=UPI0026244CAC|nr:VWA domain-containing protein [Flavobacterium sp.]